ncbi:hypothetical protein [Actinocrispum sp. NPDC049592]
MSIHDTPPVNDSPTALMTTAAGRVTAVPRATRGDSGSAGPL